MNSDPLTSFLTPPAKRRKLMAVLASPPKLSDLMAAFKAKQSPMSSSRLEKVPEVPESRETRPTKRFSYAESDSSSMQASPGSSHGGGSYQESPGKDTIDSEDKLQKNKVVIDLDEDELQSDDVIHVASRSVATRELPKRSTKTRVSYSTPKRPIKKEKVSMGGHIKPLKLTSDLAHKKNSKTSNNSQYVETERNKVRNDIRLLTKPKRDAFLRTNQEYFLPLLPETSYIDKLQRLQALKDDEDIEPAAYTSVSAQPEGVQAIMKPYQLEGLSFLIYMYENGMSAILGDEMGLGKTLQTLSLFQYLKTSEPTKGETRPFLVVCPLSVLSSWMVESKKWVPNLNVVRFHGPKAEREKLKDDCRRAGKASNIDVIVTTYETFVAEQGWFKRAFVWRYCVLDEGHKIKNDKSNVSHALQTIASEYRLLLTGTPLQNNLLEMWALLHWLYPDVFPEDTADNFKQAFDLTKGKASTTFMDDARRLLEVVMLRRMKNSPGVDLGLPPKEEVLLYVPLTPMQRFWYTRLLTKADNTMLDDLFKAAKAKESRDLEYEAEEESKHLGILEQAAAQVSDADASRDDVWAESKEILQSAVQSEGDMKTTEWRKLMNLVMQLRKVCSHPYIMPHAQPDPYYLGDHIKTASGKFIVLDKLIEELAIKQNKKVLIFAGFTTTLNLCEDLLMLKGGSQSSSKATFRYMRLDGGTGRARRNLGIRLFNSKESDCKVMLISTRAGGLGINLASASNVVFMDEDWNPQVTIQAEARAHRIGQTQKVTVYKLCTQGTVEEQMMGRIRKKLYLSAKITESMRNIHTTDARGKKRKRDSTMEMADEEAPHLDAASLKSLIRRGAQTLSRPEVDVTDMLNWDWDTVLERCKDKPIDTKSTSDGNDLDEQTWLNSMEKVECAVFEGKKHQKMIDKAAMKPTALVRSDRRVGKNTTVMIDGFAINKESLTCADWEAVPTMAGKDPRLAEPPKREKVVIDHQHACQSCWEAGEVVLCSGCPRVYHFKCLETTFQKKARGSMFYCPQHECADCQSKTSDAGGLIYRCRWCANGYCEDCLDWDTAKILGSNLPEYEMLGFSANENAWYIECPGCIKMGEVDQDDAIRVKNEHTKIESEYEYFLDKSMSAELESIIDNTPATISEVGTPVDLELPSMKKMKVY